MVIVNKKFGKTVSVQVKELSQHFNAFYDDNSLLVQFIVAEFILANQLTNQIRHLARLLFQSKYPLEQPVISLCQHFNQLLGIDASKGQHTALHWTCGPLTKLKGYCEQLTVNMQHQQKQSLTLYTHVHQAWLSAVRNYELLTILQQCVDISVSSSTLLTIKRSLHHLNQSLNHISKFMFRLLTLHKENENILFFLLRKKEILSQIYGSDFIHKIFKDFPHDELSKRVLQKYHKRGFEHLLALANQSISMA